MVPADPLLTASLASPKRGAAKGPASASLTAVHPPEVSWRLALDDGQVTIGRTGEPASASLDHRTVSRRHIAVRWEGGAHTVADLGARNGSRVDGERLDDRGRRLADGAVVQLGDVFLVYEQGEAEAGESAATKESLPGRSKVMQKLRAEVARAAPDPSPVLLLGETGTGKEWIARELHRLRDASKPLVALNCAALGAHLVESQLFGHMKGAFTGATAEQKGLFRAAEGGTLFLDEIGEMPIDLQPKLLRALQEGQVLPVGGTRPIRVEVRVVAATNRELQAAIEAGTFRRDLYARLAMWEINVPPLRARRADILDWLARLHREWVQARPAARSKPIVLLPDAVEAILLHPWPDNLRGLDRLVHLLASAGVDDPTALADLPEWLRGKPAPPTPEPGARARRKVPTREEFEQVFAELGGSVRAIAKRFDRDRRQIYRWLEAYGLKGSGDDSEDGE